ncbi:hypothetical protein [Chromobacterium sp. Panama]|nr:hypothetical protein [Chromobacterium sp. Panama]
MQSMDSGDIVEAQEQPDALALTLPSQAGMHPRGAEAARLI